jgi:hypothetical protein
MSGSGLARLIFLLNNQTVISLFLPGYSFKNCRQMTIEIGVQQYINRHSLFKHENEKDSPKLDQQARKDKSSPYVFDIAQENGRIRTGL